MSQVRQKAERVGEIAAKAVVQLLFSTGKSFTVDGLREKLREFFRQEVRAEARAVAALSNVELVTALLSCNRQLALVGLQLRIINGVVSLLTTRVENKELAAYVSEQSGARGNLQMTRGPLKYSPASPLGSQSAKRKSTSFSTPTSAGWSSDFGISSLWKNSPAPKAGCASPQLKPFYSASVSQICRNWPRPPLI
jgi:hypothetical protein